MVGEHGVRSGRESVGEFAIGAGGCDERDSVRAGLVWERDFELQFEQPGDGGLAVRSGREFDGDPGDVAEFYL